MKLKMFIFFFHLHFHYFQGFFSQTFLLTFCYLNNCDCTESFEKVLTQYKITGNNSWADFTYILIFY